MINIDKTIFNYIKSYFNINKNSIIKIVVDKQGIKIYN